MKKLADLLAVLAVLVIIGVAVGHWVSCKGQNPFVLKTVYSSHILTIANTLLLLALYIRVRK